MKNHPVLAALALAAGACAADAADPVTATEAAAPVIGKADGSDAADRGCQVMLRQVARVPGSTGGYETDCSSGVCYFVWAGTLAVADGAVGPGAEVGVLYHLAWDASWWEVPATATGDDGAFTRYAFRFADHTVGPGMSMTSLNRTEIELVAFVRLADGSRLFDHNRLPGDFDNHRLVYANMWSVADDPAACMALGPNEALVTFTRDFQHQVKGTIQAGGRLIVSYDIARLPDCRATHNGYPAWDTRAFVRFAPSGETVDGTVRAFESPTGVPTNVSYSVPFATDVPADATGIDIWFYNYSGAGNFCTAYDSNYGANYHFDVAPGAAAPGWVGNAVALISRDASDPCAGGAALASGFAFDTWARQRAAVANACFDVWQQGVTDFDNPDLWRLLDVEIHYAFGDGPLATAYVSSIGRVGNDARYAFDLRTIDPFRPYNCPDAPTTVSGEYVEAQVRFYFTVNGVELRPDGPESFYQGTFQDYAQSWWREENCP